MKSYRLTPMIPIPSRDGADALLAELNPAQAEAARTVDGPVLVIAGAGTGKTRTLIYRTAVLVNSGVAPESILLLTFTRRAAEEMRQRAGLLLDTRCDRVSGGTFHATCAGLLRRFGRAIDVSPPVRPPPHHLRRQTPGRWFCWAVGGGGAAWGARGRGGCWGLGWGGFRSSFNPSSVIGRSAMSRVNKWGRSGSDWLPGAPSAGLNVACSSSTYRIVALGDGRGRVG